MEKMNKKEFLKISKELSMHFIKIPVAWNGKKSILEMKNSEYKQWRQMEWIGFYFQFLCEKFLKNTMQIPGPIYGNVKFDGFKIIPWDFKSHAINTSNHKIIVNDNEATLKAIRKFKCIGLILANGEVRYNDKKRTFQKWHEKIKGGKSTYEFDRIQRGAWSRLRKVEFNLRQISFIKIDNPALVKCGLFQKDFRNADGTPRREKILLDLERLNEEIILFLDFNKHAKTS